jgi:hypothetical protein
MRALPYDVDAEAVIALGRYLDDHGPSTPVSVLGTIAVVRERAATTLSDEEIEELLVEMCSSRRLFVVFDARDADG